MSAPAVMTTAITVVITGILPSGCNKRKGLLVARPDAVQRQPVCVGVAEHQVVADRM